MIVLIVTRGHEYTLRKLKPTEHKFAVPKIKIINYERLFRSRILPRATYIFADIERLTQIEQRVAAEFYRKLSDANIVCLNDPAKVMSRFELLRTLYNEGINPFNIYRGDESPKPERFPVFIRHDADHGTPVTSLLTSQSQLDNELLRLRSEGTPNRGLLIVEHCSQEYLPGLWHKWGTFRVGSSYSLDHIAVEDNWLVKYGKWENLTDPIVEDEHDAVVSNRHKDILQKAFEISGIEYGRADFSVVDGKVVIYEINTNPYIARFVPDSIPLRLETQLLARSRFADALSDIDTNDKGHVNIKSSQSWKYYRSYKPGFLPPPRP